MDVLKIAAQGAAVGGASLTDTVTALGSAVAGGVRVDDLTLPFIGNLQFPHEGGVLSAIWLVGLILALQAGGKRVSFPLLGPMVANYVPAVEGWAK